MKTLVLFILSLLHSAYRAWVVTLMWGWFVCTEFGVKPLSWAAAFGILSLLSLILCEYQEEKTPEELSRVLIFHVLATTIAPLFGWVFYLLFIN